MNMITNLNSEQGIMPSSSQESKTKSSCACLTATKTASIICWYAHSG